MVTPDGDAKPGSVVVDVAVAGGNCVAVTVNACSVKIFAAAVAAGTL